MSHKSVVAVDIGQKALKAVCCRRRGKSVAITHTMVRPLDDLDPSKPDFIPQACLHAKAMLYEAGLKSDHVVVGISGPQTLFKYTHVPMMSSTKFTKLMQFELSVNLGGDMGGTANCGDYIRVNFVEDTPEQCVMFGLAQQDLVSSMRSAMSVAGLKNIQLDHSALGLYHAACLHDDIATATEPVMIVDIGRRTSDLVIIHEGMLYFARTLNTGGDTINKAIANAFGCSTEDAEQVKLNKAGQVPAPSIASTTASPNAANSDQVSTPKPPAAPAPPMESSTADDDLSLSLEDPDDSLNDDDDELTLPDDIDDDKVDAAAGSSVDSISEAPAPSEPMEDNASSTAAAPTDRNVEKLGNVIKQQSEAFASMLQASVMYARVQLRQKQLTVGKIYITGGGSKLPNLAAHIESKIQVPTAVLPALDDNNGAGVICDAEIKADSAHLNNALGLAYGHLVGKESFDFTPLAEKQKREYRATVAFLYAAIGCFVACLVVMILSSSQTLSAHEAYFNDLENIKKTAEKKESDFQKHLGTHDVLVKKDDFLRKRLLGYTHLSYLIARFKTLAGKKIVIKGVRMGDSTDKLIQNLLAEEVFEDVQVSVTATNTEKFDLPEDLDTAPRQPFVVTGYVLIKGSKAQSYDVLDEFMGKLEADSAIEKVKAISSEAIVSEDGKRHVLLFSLRLQMGL